MEYYPTRTAAEHINSPNCIVRELGGTAVHDFATARINGCYPGTKFAVNEEVEMSICVMKGTGQLVTRDTVYDLNSGDAAVLNRGEAYYYDKADNLEIFMICTPAWSPAQYRE
jgi:mannose-6-phosphate isomerase-like protein (cupin superfamily)